MFTNLLNDQQGGLHADMDDLQKMLLSPHGGAGGLGGFRVYGSKGFRV